jgi:magnesium-transporting ATPase (P-type)
MEQNIQQNAENKLPNKTKNEVMLIIVEVFFIAVGIIFAVTAYKWDQADPNDPLGLSGLPLLGSLANFFIAFILSLLTALFRKTKRFFIINIIILLLSCLIPVSAIYFITK